MIIVALFFGIWIVLTVAAQLPITVVSALLRWDWLGLVPRWTFFAPRPGDSDIRTLIRFVNSGVTSAWMELWLSARLDGTRYLVRGVFNPYRRCEKLLLDYVNTLGDLQGTPNAIRFTSEYLSLLMMSEDLARKRGAESVQFMIAEIGGPQYNRFKVILISDKHPVNTGQH